MIKFKKCLFYFNIITFFIVIGLSAFLLMNLEDFKQSLVIAQSEDQHDEIEYADIYIDSRAPEGGNGSLEAPYNNLSIINDLTITPGTIIRLRAGSIFEAPFIIENIEGDENNPVIIGKYGSGRRPIIAANDYTGGGILYIKNCQNIIVESLELFDTATLEGDRRGILIEIGGGTEENILYYNNITVQDMYVHDIRGITDAENSGMSNASKKTGGIMAWTKDKFTAYNNLIINNNIVRNVDNCGIAIWKVPTTSPQGTVYDADFDFIAHKNVYITNNEISDIGKNAIVVRYLLGGHISGNTVYKTAVRCISGNQIFTRDCKGTIIERNEGFMNMARPDKAGVVRDGSMLDPDLRSPDTIWQYNYSHDNAFGLMTNCTDVRDNIVVRYNISVADKSYLLNINYDVNSMHIYNNTFYIPQNYNSIIIHERKQKLSQRDENRNYIFENNLIYNDSLSASFDFAVLGESGTHNDIVNTITRSFSNNLLYSAKSEEQGFTLPKAELFEYANGKDGELQSGYLKANPMIVKAYGGTSVERIGWGILNNFKLLKQSPALGAGKPISDGLTHCFFGNIITSPPNIGAYGGMGEEQDLEQDAYLNPDDYSTPRFDNVEKISDIVYAESVTNYDGTKRNLKLDIYRPKNDMQRNRPLVVMVHGGGFRIGSTKEQNYIVNLSNLFARHGYVVAAIEYRLRKGSDMPDRLAEVPAMIDAAEDVNRALEWLRTKGGVYGYNPDYMFVAGGSAGGRTAVAYAYSSQEKGYDKSGVVAIGNLWGSPEIEFRSEYDVSNQFEGRFIPMIIIHGTNDNTIPYDNAIYMKNSLLNAGYNEGVDFAFQAIQGGGHPPTNVSNGTQIIFDYVNTFFIARLKNYIQNVTNGVTPPPP
ncbi:MAG: alpha/beta hydrolase, partial [Clostridiales bacterium]|nr:alpha/beta hydrolase [Clostridiales bacterium]